MKILGVSQIRELDKSTLEQEAIVSIDLMERASRKFVETFTKEISPLQRIFVFAGPGNNGGDALAVARLLIEQSYPVESYLLNTKGQLSPDCEANRNRLLSIPSVVLHEIKDTFTAPSISKEDVIIDGLFGSGLNKPLSGGFASLVNYINRTGARIYSIDIPSGLFGENNTLNAKQAIIQAYKTFTFQFPKLAFLLPDSGIYAGNWDVLDIGLHPETIVRTKTPFYYMEQQEIVSLLKTRNRFDYKNRFGHALIIAGSRGKIGAAVLCTKAAMRAGAGLATVYLPACGEPVLQTAFPEVMVQADPETDYISVAPEISVYSSVGFGPGIGMNQATANVLKALLTQSRQPLVLDADALNILAQNKEWIKLIPASSILTPHLGEFDRLAGGSLSSSERLQKARNLAVACKCIIVLKGAYTAVCSPASEVYFNSTGNPGMATAGSGDVLTGIIAGLLAQNYPPLDAARIGVYLHGLAGDIAKNRFSEESMLAGDIVDALGEAFRQIQAAFPSV